MTILKINTAGQAAVSTTFDGSDTVERYSAGMPGIYLWTTHDKRQNVNATASTFLRSLGHLAEGECVTGLVAIGRVDEAGHVAGMTDQELSEMGSLIVRSVVLEQEAKFPVQDAGRLTAV